jgi:hypothetical protein
MLEINKVPNRYYNRLTELGYRLHYVTGSTGFAKVSLVKNNHIVFTHEFRNNGLSAKVIASKAPTAKEFTNHSNALLALVEYAESQIKKSKNNQ